MGSSTGQSLLLYMLRRNLKHLALSAGRDGLLKLWDLERCECAQRLSGHAGPVRCITVDWTLKRALSGGDDGQMRLWDLERSACMEELADSVQCVTVDWAT